MSLTLTTLAGSMLVLGWQGDPESTYTLQASTDCAIWETLPFVMGGASGEMRLSCELPKGATWFLRLRSSREGDSNSNGLPDTWEWEHFSHLDVDPLADPDEDGLSNYTEWLGHTGPRDFFNGISPSLRSACGRQWIVRSGEVSTQALAILLSKPSGEPWADAPVRIRLERQRAALIQAGESPAEAVEEMIAYTDERGMISTSAHAVHVLGSPVPIDREKLLLEAGSADLEIAVHTVPAGYTGPPRQVRYRIATGGQTFLSWQGSPGESTRFLLEERTPANDWIQVMDVDVSELPDPDAYRGEYLLAHTPES